MLASGATDRPLWRKSKRTVDDKGFTLMTLPYLQELCKEQKGYTTPALNDHLYLHYKGFARIGEDILHYSGLKTLWLEGNVLSEIDYIDQIPTLKCLYLQENCFEKLTHIANMQNLAILNVSNNILTELPAELAQLPLLSSLHASNNKLKTADSIAVLRDCHALSVLDLHHNQLDGEECITEVLYRMPSLAVLTLHHNPCVQRVTNYRRQFIVHVSSLTYLDDRPVSDNERAASLAWAQGGVEAERNERARQASEERAEMKRNFDALAALQAEHRAKRIAAGEDLSDAPNTFANPGLEKFYKDMVNKIDENPEEPGNGDDMPELETAATRDDEHTNVESASDDHHHKLTIIEETGSDLDEEGEQVPPIRSNQQTMDVKGSLLSKETLRPAARIVELNDESPTFDVSQPEPVAEIQEIPQNSNEQNNLSQTQEALFTIRERPNPQPEPSRVLIEEIDDDEPLVPLATSDPLDKQRILIEEIDEVEVEKTEQHLSRNQDEGNAQSSEPTLNSIKVEPDFQQKVFDSVIQEENQPLVAQDQSDFVLLESQAPSKSVTTAESKPLFEKPLGDSGINLIEPEEPESMDDKSMPSIFTLDLDDAVPQRTATPDADRSALNAIRTQLRAEQPAASSKRPSPLAHRLAIPPSSLSAMDIHNGPPAPHSTPVSESFMFNFSSSTGSEESSLASSPATGSSLTLSQPVPRAPARHNMKGLRLIPGLISPASRPSDSLSSPTLSASAGDQSPSMTPIPRAPHSTPVSEHFAALDLGSSAMESSVPVTPVRGASRVLAAPGISTLPKALSNNNGSSTHSSPSARLLPSMFLSRNSSGSITPLSPLCPRAPCSTPVGETFPELDLPPAPHSTPASEYAASPLEGVLSVSSELAILPTASGVPKRWDPRNAPDSDDEDDDEGAQDEQSKIASVELMEVSRKGTLATPGAAWQ